MMSILKIKLSCHCHNKPLCPIKASDGRRRKYRGDWFYSIFSMDYIEITIDYLGSPMIT